MKRYIKSVTQRTLDSHLIDGFKNYGFCPDVTIEERFQDHYKMKLVLPNNITTHITVWFNPPTRVATGGLITKNNVTYTIDPTWVFLPNGDVQDASGNIIGQVQSVKLNTTRTVQRTRKDYSLTSVRTDSGDVIIDHPEKNAPKIYKDIVNTLMARTITHRS